MYWNWLKSGIALGTCFFVALVLVKPIGVSTQFVVVDGLGASVVVQDLVVADETAKSGYSSSNAYLNKSGGKYAKSVAKPLNYGFVFVLFMTLGGFLGGLLQRKDKSTPISQVPRCHQQRFGDKAAWRYVLAFVGGFLVLFGARLAGGCTSGHMMSGMMQTAVSGYLFASAAFIVAVPTALFLYRSAEVK